MRFLLGLLFLCLLNPGLSYSQERLDPKCQSLEVGVEIGWKMSGAEVTVTGKGFKNPTNFIFFDKGGRLLSQQVRENKIDKLLPGKYYCVLRDSRGCSKIIDFEVLENPNLNE